MKWGEALLLLRSVHQRARKLGEAGQTVRSSAVQFSDLEFTALEVAILSLEKREEAE